VIAHTKPVRSAQLAAGPGFECTAIAHSFASRRDIVTALEGVTFEARPHEFVCVVGPSGCGKTTLLRIIAGLLPATSGHVRFTGQTEPAPRCGLVFQEHGTFPWMSVLDNVAFGLEMSGMPRVQRHERAMAFVERVGLGAFAHAYPHELSVGMRQRVGIARAFVSGAPILLMDEPFGALDAQTKWVLREELLRIWQADRKLILYVTHDIEEAVLLGDRVLVMTGRPGRIREEIPIPFGRPRDLERDPARVSDITWHIWRLLEEEVRDGLSIRS
jgi:NitT/TauT family transport system ATP-binding protein